MIIADVPSPWQNVHHSLSHHSCLLPSFADLEPPFGDGRWPIHVPVITVPLQETERPLLWRILHHPFTLLLDEWGGGRLERTRRLPRLQALIGSTSKWFLIGWRHAWLVYFWYSRVTHLWWVSEKTIIIGKDSLWGLSFGWFIMRV